MALVTTTEMFKKAYDGGYAIGAFNVNNMEIVQAITEACREEKAPVILQVSKGARAYANHTYLVKLVEAAVIECPEIPIALHLDHGDSFETCKSCIDGGFTSVMIDASSKPFAENIAITQQGCGVRPRPRCCGGGRAGRSGRRGGRSERLRRGLPLHPSRGGGGVRVQDRLRLPGHRHRHFSHGAYKFKPGTKPQLRFDILEEVIQQAARLPHRAARLFLRAPGVRGDGEHLRRCQMPGAIGVPEDQLRHAAELAVCKINIDSDLRLAMTGTIRKFFAEHPDKFDPREYLKPARANIKELVRHKLVDVLGCAGKA